MTLLLLFVLQIVLFPLLLSQSLSHGNATISCADDAVYAMIVKKTRYQSSDESFTVVCDGIAVFSSPAFSNMEVKTMETCLPVSSNHVYTLQMEHRSFYWSDGAWLEIYGINGNRALKVMMIQRKNETVDFSLSTPINKGEEWLYADYVDEYWRDGNYIDETWMNVTLGMDLGNVGAHYFRKPFEGFDNMAAIE